MTKGSNTLTPMRRRAVDRLLIDYLELPEREQPAWLARTRQRLPRLGRWLVQLVDDSHTVTLLDESVRRLAGQSVDRMEINAARLTEGDRLGPWQVIEEIGEGGMGRVYRGQRADGAFEMDVAIKQIGRRRRGLAELLQRECRLLAKLDHPSVTRLIDAGLDDRAGPFLVMEWIEGTDLDDWLNSEQPDLAFRLDRFEHILEAVEHAHQRLIVHGDIKPGNIRIATNGAVKLMDFGIARLQESSGEDDAQMRALTPSFAAPEQLSGEPINVRSDVYSLGMLLYWLLTGETPGHGKAGIGERLRHLSRRRRREVIAIFERACHVEPEQRYASVSAMLADIRHLRSGKPISAMPATRRYRLRCMVSRNPIATGLGTLLALSLVVGTGALILQAEQTRLAAEQAISEGQRAMAVRDFLVEMLSEADPHLTPGEPPTVRDVLRRSGDRVSERFVNQPDIAFELLSVIGAAHQGLGDSASARPFFRSALETLRAEPAIAREPLDLARATYMLATVLESSDERRQLLEQTLAELKRHDQQDPMLESGVLQRLAHDAFSRQDNEAAAQQALAAEALACTDEVIAEDPDPCIAVLSDLFFYLSGAGQPDRALNAARRSYELASEHFGDQAHPSLVSSGISYANALIDHRRPSEAIALAEELLEILAIYSDEQSPVEAFIHFPLARAHSSRGSDHVAVEKWSRALDLMLERLPDGLGIPVQLNFLVSRLLELGQVDQARAAYETYFPVTWDNTPDHALWFRRLNELLMEELTNGVPDHRWRHELKEFQENSAHQVTHILRFAFSAALDRGDLASAQGWKQTAIDADVEAGGPGVWETLRARYRLQRGELDDARLWLAQAAEAFKQLNETTGPRLSSLRAVEAELLCRSGQLEPGIEHLQAALNYWLNEARLAEQIESVNRLAPSCPATN
ncbi:MAG: serine/threonine protein kinase [Wenzhouxiangella sp.]|nr:MAG: serine/threonine protein kinase [Wenzhouxiangella sp.]